METRDVHLLLVKNRWRWRRCRDEAAEDAGRRDEGEAMAILGSSSAEAGALLSLLRHSSSPTSS